MVLSATHLWLVAAGLSAALAIACEERATRHAAFYVLKPLTTVLVLGAALSASAADPHYRLWVALALVFSICGDIALTRSGPLAFVIGLGSFLVAHGLFVWAFWSPNLHLPPAWSLLPVAAGLGFFIWLLPQTADLRIPVTVYGLALMAMCLVAAARAEWRADVSGMLAAAGAVIFLVSDSALAVNQFRGQYRRAQLLILSTYWLAVSLLAASVQNSAAF
ncbi:MAG: lysoplasmalogenase [Panacagrimonas sp.]